MPVPPLPILYAEDTPFTDYFLAVWGRVFNALRDEALLLDLGGLGRRVGGGEDGIAYDRSMEVVSVTPARTGREVNDFLTGQVGGPGDESEEGVGRFFPGGHSPDIGLGGFLLQGGMGLELPGAIYFCWFVLMTKKS